MIFLSSQRLRRRRVQNVCREKAQIGIIERKTETYGAVRLEAVAAAKVI
jgi:hypothetical protein